MTTKTKTRRSTSGNSRARRRPSLTIVQPETHVSRIRDLYDEFLVCRTIGHSWDDNPAAEFTTIFNWTIALRCDRCTTERLDHLNNLGEVLARQYKYPDGYKVAGTRQGQRAVSKLQLRAELMRRQVLARRRPRRVS